MSRLFVTGGAGFVGRALLRAAQARGDSVRALWHRTPIRMSGVELVRGSLLEPEGFTASLRGVDVVLHCAALLDPIDSAAAAEAVNLHGSVALATAAARAGVGAFVFMSSSATIGDAGSGLIDEDAACHPVTLYGHSKRQAELALMRLPLGSMRLLLLRPPTVYGPEERRNFLALTRAVAGRRVFIPGRGDNRMSFCHVDNLAHAGLTLADHPSATGIVHVADAESVTFRQVVNTLGDALGQRGFVPRLPMPLARAIAIATETAWRRRKGAPPFSRQRLRTISADFALDTTRARSLGVRSRFRFDVGVRETVDAYRRAGVL